MAQMTIPRSGNDHLHSSVVRSWFPILVLVSAALLVVTFVSYATQGNGLWTRLLFLIGLGGENNIGAWWSGMLLFLGAVLAFDGCRIRSRSEHERRGWLTLAAILLLMSFDEVGSVHEHEWISFVTYGLVGLSMLSFSIAEFLRGHTERRTIGLILLSFGLFGTIALQESLQHSLTWNNQVVYGARALLEEGTEIAAMLLLIAVGRANTAHLLKAHPREVLAFTVHFREPLLAVGIVLAPALAGATFILPYPGGPANWMAASLYFLCALALVRGVLVGKDVLNARLSMLLALYVGASAMSCFVRFTYDLTIFGAPINLRGLGLCGTLLMVSELMRMNGRDAPGVAMKGCAVAVLGLAWLLPDTALLGQSAWCLVPSLVALWVYAVESGHGVRSLTQSASGASARLSPGPFARWA